MLPRNGVYRQGNQASEERIRENPTMTRNYSSNNGLPGTGKIVSNGDGKYLNERNRSTIASRSQDRL